MPLIQEISNTDKVVKVLDNMDKYTLTAFFFLVEVTNSVIISLNILYKNVSYNLVWRDCNLEEEYNQLKWGTDEDFKKKLLYKKNLKDAVKKIYLKRKKTYNEAEFKIKCSYLKSNEIADKVLKLYEKSRNKI